MVTYERRSRTTVVSSFWYNGRVAQLAERVCEKHETVVQIHSPAATTFGRDDCINRRFCLNVRNRTLAGKRWPLRSRARNRHRP
jgi:hypothetical protein